MTYVPGVIVILLLMVAVVFILSAVDQRRLGKHRGVTRDEFVAAFADLNISPAIPAAVYDFYKGQVISKQFSVAPDDEYERILSAGDEDIDDDARFLMKKLALKAPRNYGAVRAQTPIRTLRDMVLWLSWIQSQQNLSD